MRSRFKAFTLIEMVVTAGLIALLAAITGLSFSHVRGQAGANGFTMAIAEELRRARSEAIAYRRPVAFCIPTNNGQVSYSSSFYVMEGESDPLITRTQNYAGDYNNACLFVGKWSGAPPATMPPALGSKWQSFSATTWLNSISDAGSTCATDFCFIFLPDGSLVTNGLPGFDNNYHIVVASGVKALGGGFTVPLTAAGECFTISLSPIGGISTTGGLLGQDGSVPVNGSMETPAAPGKAPQLSSRASQAPATDASIYPLISPVQTGALPPGANATVTTKEFITLEMSCESPVGDELFCSYSVSVTVPSPSHSPGTFSVKGVTGTMVESPVGSGNWTAAGGRMEWDPQANAIVGTHEVNTSKGAWRSTWQWTPPPDAVEGDTYLVSSVVQNNKAGSPKLITVPQTMVVHPPGQILYEASSVSGVAPDVWSMDEAGNGPVKFRANASQATASLNAARMAWVRGGNIWLSFRSDPTLDLQLTTSASDSIPSLSPAGNLLAFRRSDQIYVMRTEPESGTNVAHPVGPACAYNSNGIDSRTLLLGTDKMSWTNDGSKLLYTHSSGDVYACSIGPGSTPAGAPGSQFIASSTGGTFGYESPVSSVSYGTDSQVFWINNYNGPDNGAGNAHPWYYDPYLFGATSATVLPSGISWWESSYLIEDMFAERNPRGGNLLLESMAPVTTAGVFTGPRQIVRMDSSGASGSGSALPYVTLTRPAVQPGSGQRPVWTQL